MASAAASASDATTTSRRRVAFTVPLAVDQSAAARSLAVAAACLARHPALEVASARLAVTPPPPPPPMPPLLAAVELAEGAPRLLGGGSNKTVDFVATFSAPCALRGGAGDASAAAWHVDGAHTSIALVDPDPRRAGGAFNDTYRIRLEVTTPPGALDADLVVGLGALAGACVDARGVASEASAGRCVGCRGASERPPAMRGGLAGGAYECQDAASGECAARDFVADFAPPTGDVSKPACAAPSAACFAASALLDVTPPTLTLQWDTTYTYTSALTADLLVIASEPLRDEDVLAAVVVENGNVTADDEFAYDDGDGSGDDSNSGIVAVVTYDGGSFTDGGWAKAWLIEVALERGATAVAYVPEGALVDRVGLPNAASNEASLRQYVSGGEKAAATAVASAAGALVGAGVGAGVAAGGAGGGAAAAGGAAGGSAGGAAASALPVAMAFQGFAIASLLNVELPPNFQESVDGLKFVLLEGAEDGDVGGDLAAGSEGAPSAASARRRRLLQVQDMEMATSLLVIADQVTAVTKGKSREALDKLVLLILIILPGFFLFHTMLVFVWTAFLKRRPMPAILKLGRLEMMIVVAILLPLSNKAALVSTSPNPVDSGVGATVLTCVLLVVAAIDFVVVRNLAMEKTRTVAFVRVDKAGEPAEGMGAFDDAEEDFEGGWKEVEDAETVATLPAVEAVARLHRRTPSSEESDDAFEDADEWQLENELGSARESFTSARDEPVLADRASTDDPEEPISFTPSFTSPRSFSVARRRAKRVVLGKRVVSKKETRVRYDWAPTRKGGESFHNVMGFLYQEMQGKERVERGENGEVVKVRKRTPVILQLIYPLAAINIAAIKGLVYGFFRKNSSAEELKSTDTAQLWLLVVLFTFQLLWLSAATPYQRGLQHALQQLSVVFQLGVVAAAIELARHPGMSDDRRDGVGLAMMALGGLAAMCPLIYFVVKTGEPIVAKARAKKAVSKGGEAATSEEGGEKDKAAAGSDDDEDSRRQTSFWGAASAALFAATLGAEVAAGGGDRF